MVSELILMHKHVAQIFLESYLELMKKSMKSGSVTNLVMPSMDSKNKD